VFDEQQKGGAQTDAPAATPEAQAALDAGLAAVREAEALITGPKPSAAAKAAYSKARAKFAEATKADPNLAQAWNGLGYSNRKLGDYKAALTAYDKAIELRMGYPEATEYRGEAYLALNRPEDAKQAYLDLFATNRELAAKLLESMKTWASTARNKDDAADMKDFIDERTKIAAQTVALTRESATKGWN
jgi:tetratricopeptide (TPR) repeat protein